MTFESRENSFSGKAQVEASNEHGSSNLHAEAYQPASSGGICKDPYAVYIGQDDYCREGFVYPSDPNYSRVLKESVEATKSMERGLRGLEHAKVCFDTYITYYCGTDGSERHHRRHH